MPLFVVGGGIVVHRARSRQASTSASLYIPNSLVIVHQQAAAVGGGMLRMFIKYTHTTTGWGEGCGREGLGSVGRISLCVRACVRARAQLHVSARIGAHRNKQTHTYTVRVSIYDMYN